MSNLLHPGLILIAVGVIAMLVPKMLRKLVLAVGPFFALFAALSMPVGTDLSFEFFGTGYQLGYMYVDKLSYVFCMIFALMACISVDRRNSCVNSHANQYSPEGQVMRSLGQVGNKCVAAANLEEDTEQQKVTAQHMHQKIAQTCTTRCRSVAAPD